jgi:hypothetical protein
VPLAFGWEVPVSFLRSASGSDKESRCGMERGTSSEAARGNGMNFNSGRVDGLVILLGDFDAL